MKFSGALVAAFAAAAWAHPGDDVHEELAEQRRYHANTERSSLAHCAEKLKARGVTQRNVERRMKTLNQAREKRGLKKRSLEEVLNTDHNSTDLGYTTATPADTLFAGQNSCILTPDVVLGPYYVGGESIRPNIVDDEPGVNLILDYQVIDVQTCEPIPELYLEIWHANSTGVYSGVVNSGNGNVNDKSNIDKTAGRGIQPTDVDGVAQFETFFPGHYIGRATHIHILAHSNATVFDNQTLGNHELFSSHVGQTYFDQDLINEVKALSPYTQNTQPYTSNAQDFLLADAANQGFDPVVEWTLVGDSAAEGIFGWLAFGIDKTASAKVTPAAFMYKEGGQANPDFNGGFPPGGGFPGGPPGGTEEKEEK